MPHDDTTPQAGDAVALRTAELAALQGRYRLANAQIAAQLDLARGTFQRISGAIEEVEMKLLEGDPDSEILWLVGQIKGLSNPRIWA